MSVCVLSCGEDGDKAAAAAEGVDDEVKYLIEKMRKNRFIQCVCGKQNVYLMVNRGKKKRLKQQRYRGVGSILL